MRERTESRIVLVFSVGKNAGFSTTIIAASRCTIFNSPCTGTSSGAVVYDGPAADDAVYVIPPSVEWSSPCDVAFEIRRRVVCGAVLITTHSFAQSLAKRQSSV